MLRKKLCVKCRIETKHGWTVVDEEAWKDGFIFCPCFDYGEVGMPITSEHLPRLPQGCFYILEQSLNLHEEDPEILEENERYKMKIMEKRECCDPVKDFVIYNGNLKINSATKGTKFCKHCGQVWITRHEPDGAEGSLCWAKVDITNSVEDCVKNAP